MGHTLLPAPTHRASPARVAGAYFLFALAWIWLSDRALLLMGVDPVETFWASALKGTAFVALSSALLYVMVRREVRALVRAIWLLRSVTEGTTDAVFVKDLKGRYLLLNGPSARFAGKSIEETVGKDDTELFDPETARRLVDQDRAVIESGELRTWETDLGTALGPRTYFSTKIPYRDESGRTVGVIGTARDVTDRKRAEAELRDSEQRYRALVELAPESIIIVCDGRIVFANPATARMMKAPSTDALIGLEINSRLHPDEVAESVTRQALILRDGVTMGPREVRIRRLDGVVIDVETCAGPCVVNGVTGMQILSRDITERKRATALLAHQNRVLERIASGAPLPVVLDEIVRIVEDQLPGVACSVLLLDRDGVHLRLGSAPNLPADYNAGVNGFAIGPSVGSCGTAAFSRKPVFVNDIATDPLWADYKHLALGHGLRACWSVPIFAAPRGPAPRTVLGTFAVYAREPSAPDPRFAELIERAEHLASIAIESDRAVRDLRESEDRFTRFMAHLPGLAWIKDADGRYVYANSTIGHLFGVAPADLCGRTDRDVAPARAAEQFQRNDQRVLASGAGLQVVETLTAPDGAEVTFLSGKFPIPGPDGRPALVGGVAIDITEHQRAERALREREEQLRLFVDHVWAPIAMVDREMRYIHVSRRWLTDYHVALPDVTGLCHYDVFPEIPDRWKEAHKRCLAGAVERCDEDRFERADGSIQWVRWEVRPWYLPGGEVGGLVMSTEDITARKRLEAQFQQAAKMEAVGRLAGGIAHDFNNLLTVINGFSDLILRDTGEADSHRLPLMEIRAAGDRAARLTHQLLAYSRKAMIEPKVLDLNELVTESLKLLRLVGEDVIVATVLDPALARIRADRGQIEQVLLNLVVNARDAMPNGGRVTIETQNISLGADDWTDEPDLKPGPYVRLTVTDTGAGMTEQVRAKIFEPFFTTKGVGKGTGLGLAVVHGAVKQSGGHVSVTSELGVGTAFTLLFPAVSAAPETAPAAIPAPTGGTETVLLVEDEDAVRSITRLSLTGQGYKVLAVGSGAEAIRAVEKHTGRIDLLVTDVVMPEMGGRQLAEVLHRRLPNLRVLYMSGYTDEVVLRRDRTEAFLQKPFSPQMLVSKVRDMLDVSK
ncbi:multi-sensor hybrid histidine kinase : Multi-sensor hybrid histidine kinase OS=Chthoniobacter flavus Ellin428 GN=CfE428DRAFT_3487 PE=4 SV=1: PAS_4: PAS_8: GAF_2: PAS_4: PAS_4: HisKA: HATPase_c: Response_reg [Gemmata massiliana]|uniref:histidine kinase n=1 Tax=Gemmata massiliana TaxID=1210884 RepID=A0A6P2CXN1_9BACT|nr:PAS domain-containing protein [Gemmata massiliana]VTR93898.1 multi-sensor hybrid histidine kinase : Multi-sensor hybrid histidine kinase OS=Chthoniobacter flavus Ellin428 GN=CfE428DRAFT_3487 PE=4 SV=1: PAS_4: PAS_8: GAF_2: PAS_4: PAS_4: HisKA: HATPase_c: Response_reg [Gemmata massiliana]